MDPRDLWSVDVLQTPLAKGPRNTDPGQQLIESVPTGYATHLAK
jgi:hypothetical protein